MPIKQGQAVPRRGPDGAIRGCAETLSTEKLGQRIYSRHRLSGFIQGSCCPDYSDRSGHDGAFGGPENAVFGCQTPRSTHF
jgi:hypothetical protein